MGNFLKGSLKSMIFVDDGGQQLVGFSLADKSVMPHFGNCSSNVKAAKALVIAKTSSTIEPPRASKHISPTQHFFLLKILLIQLI